MQNKIWTTILVVLIGILSGLSILVGISVAIQLALAPVYNQLNNIAETQKQIELKLVQGAGGGDSSQVLAQLGAIDRKIQAMEQRVGAQQPAQAAQQRPPSEDLNKVYDIPVGQSPLYGSKDAPVMIIEFMDLQCPFCARFHMPIAEVLKAYPGKVSYMIKHYPLPFHPQAKPAAKAALAAHEQGKFFDMVDMILKSQADLNEEKFYSIAKDIGLNVDKFKKDLKDKDAQWEKIIQDDMALAGQSDVRGTPTFFINGKKTMARDFATYKAEIDKILQDAKK